MEPRKLAKGDAARTQQRVSVTLTAGRRVQPKTMGRREKLKEAFVAWLELSDLTWDIFLSRSKKDSDFANDQLIAYGRALFQDGRVLTLLGDDKSLQRCLPQHQEASTTGLGPGIRLATGGASGASYCYVLADSGRSHHGGSGLRMDGPRWRDCTRLGRPCTHR